MNIDSNVIHHINQKSINHVQKQLKNGLEKHQEG